VRFEWDDEKEEANLSKHGVSFAEAATALRDPLSVTASDPDHSEMEQRFLTFGVSADGRLLVVAMARWSQKRMPEADAALADLINNNADGAAYQIAEVYAYREEKDQAFQWLERAHRQRDSGLVGLQIDPFLKNLHPDPRWNAFLHKMGLANDQLK